MRGENNSLYSKNARRHVGAYFTRFSAGRSRTGGWLPSVLGLIAFICWNTQRGFKIQAYSDRHRLFSSLWRLPL